MIQKFKIILVFFVFILGQMVIAQSLRPTNSVNLNLLGDASAISVHFDKQYFLNRNLFFSGKIGIGYNERFDLSSDVIAYQTFPHQITANYGGKRQFLEMGVGGTILVGNTSQPYIPYAIVGYRIQPLKKNRINFRIFGQLPFLGFENIEDILFFPIGASVGFSF